MVTSAQLNVSFTLKKEIDDDQKTFYQKDMVKNMFISLSHTLSFTLNKEMDDK
jgi:hypothetical protein